MIVPGYLLEIVVSNAGFAMSPIDLLVVKRTCKGGYRGVTTFFPDLRIHESVEHVILTRWPKKADLFCSIFSGMSTTRNTYLFGSVLLSAILFGTNKTSFVVGDIDFISSLETSNEQVWTADGSATKNTIGLIRQFYIERIDGLVDGLVDGSTDGFHHRIRKNGFLDQRGGDQSYDAWVDRYIFPTGKCKGHGLRRTKLLECVVCPSIDTVYVPESSGSVWEHVCKTTALPFCRILYDGKKLVVEDYKTLITFGLTSGKTQNKKQKTKHETKYEERLLSMYY